MRRFVEQADRGQWTLLPECLDDFIDESNPVRVIDVFVDALDLAEMGFEGAELAATGRPSYPPSVLLKLYIYGYLNRVQSSRRLEREAGRNVYRQDKDQSSKAPARNVLSNTGFAPLRQRGRARARQIHADQSARQRPGDVSRAHAGWLLPSEDR